jgi:hypothetical protein
MNEDKSEEKKSSAKVSAKLIEGIDFYFENGLMVLTAHFLKNRGYCCGSDCRHCPYPKKENVTL